MKKILLLGGSAQQVVAIEKAKELGYYTVLCDYLSDNPGQFVADKFYLVSTTDKEAVYDVALKEKIDGVVAYASDPAAPTAAYVAEKLGLPTNPFKSVDILCNKDKFRKFLAENGFNTPKAKGYSNIEDAVADISSFSFPVIVKPVDSSGSKGVKVIYEKKDIDLNIEKAFSFSKRHQIIIEQFIEKKHQYLIGGDIFVQDGIVKVWGLLNCHRDYRVNQLVPVGKSFPLDIDFNDEIMIHDTIQKIVDLLHISFGSINIEIVIGNDNKVYPIDIGPRAGGNMIPNLLGDIFNVDIPKMNILLAMNETVEIKMGDVQGFFATHNLHSSESGLYNKIVFSKKLEKYIYRKFIYRKKGDVIYRFDEASKCLGVIFMKFKSYNEMTQILNNIENYYYVEFCND